VAKKPKNLRPAAPASPLLSRRGKIVIGIGVLTVALGFWLLTFTDPAGQNWASNLCPFVILGGYALIGIGIVLPDPEPLHPSSASR
jgi:dipeptide/tripeptide permease